MEGLERIKVVGPVVVEALVPMEALSFLALEALELPETDKEQIDMSRSTKFLELDYIICISMSNG